MIVNATKSKTNTITITFQIMVPYNSTATKDIKITFSGDNTITVNWEDNGFYNIQ